MNKFNMGDRVDMHNLKKLDGVVISFFLNPITNVYRYDIDWSESRYGLFVNSINHISEIGIRKGISTITDDLNKL